MDTASTSDAVTFITYVQTLKRKIKQFEKQVDVSTADHVWIALDSVDENVIKVSFPVQLFRNGQRLLEKQRFQFPPSWLYIDNIEGEWGAFSDIMKRKDTAIQQQVANLQMKIVQEDRAVENRTTDLLSDWEKTKPVAVRVWKCLSGETVSRPPLTVCLLVVSAGQSASRGGAAVAHHLRGQIRPSEG